MTEIHAMMPEPSHDERAEQLFVRDFKAYLWGMSPLQKRIATGVAAGLADQASDPPPLDRLRDAMWSQDTYREWTRHRRTSQEMLWDAIGASVDRQVGALEAKARIERPLGSLELNPDLQPPPYVQANDVHLMPGGYMKDRGDGDVRQGAIMDRGGAVYLLGRNGGLMNDGRGHALVSHIFDRAPDFHPERTLELGCGVGASAVAVASYFPKAENWGIDVGGALLRYAHARAEHLGVGLHLAQRDAEKTQFPDNHFDLVYTCAVLHETSSDAVSAICGEARRILKPGGMMVHLEVPSRYETDEPWDRLQGDFEELYNNEPFWHGANSADYVGKARDAGFGDIMVGYQATRPRAERGNKGFSQVSSGAFACWFVVSAVK